MQKIILFFLLVSISITTVAQEKRPSKDSNKVKLQKAVNNAADTLKKRMASSDPLVSKTHYTDFKVFDVNRDTTYIDTTLSIQKEYRFNYLRKDDFELIPFHNQGQTFNRLAYAFEDCSLIPTIGASAKHFNYYEISDIDYYRVATPTSELMYRTGLEQGQVLDALLTMNTSPEFNFSIAYKGLRSLGKYRNALSSHGNFRTTFNYTSKNKQYDIRGHITAQDLMNQENGGLTPLSLTQFLSGDANYKQRGRLDVNLTDAESMLEGKRYFIEQRYRILKVKQDTVQKSQITLGNTYSYETKHFKFKQNSTSSLFGEALSPVTNDDAAHRQHNVSVYTAVKSPVVLGTLKLEAMLHRFDYTFEGTLDTLSADPISLKDTKFSIKTSWNTTFKKILLKAALTQQITGDDTSKSLQLSATYKKDSLNWFSGFLNAYSKAPDLNYQLYRSNYKDYNWSNDFSNLEVWNAGAAIFSKKWLNAVVSYSKIDQWHYFTEGMAAPTQATETVNYLKVSLSKGFHFSKFGLENTVLYQKVTEGAAVLSVPELVTRNTLYYSTPLFKGDPIYIQTGVTLKYFSSFYAPSYNPLLGEFTQQNTVKIGDFPTVDFFINGQIQRTRLYLKAENITANFSGRNYFSAPNYPTRDFTVRFGLVWNFFI